MSSRNFYTNNASTPIRSGALVLPLASASTIASSSLRKNLRAHYKYSNTSSERSRDSKNEAGPRGRTGSRDSDDVETRKRKTRREERKKIIKRHLEAWGGYGRSQEITKECHDPLIATENITNSDQLKKTDKNDSIASCECQESSEAVYPWEKPIELVRDHAKVVDDLESIFDKPLLRLQDPRSQKKNEILPGDLQLIESDDDFGWNDLAVGPIRTYPGPTKSGDVLHRVEKQIHQTRHIRYRQLMLQIRRKSEDKTKKVDGLKRKKRQRRSSAWKMVRTRGRLGAGYKSRIYDYVSSSSEESSNQQIGIFKWDSNRGKFVRRPLSPAKSLNWGIRAYHNKPNELFDEMYREYAESLPREKKKNCGGDRFRDFRAEQTLIRSRRKIDQEKMFSGRKKSVESSRSNKKISGMFDNVPQSFSSSLSIRTSFADKLRVDDNDSILFDPTPAPNYTQSCAAELGPHENDEPTSETSLKNWPSKSQKKSSPLVENYPRRIFAVPSNDLIDLSVDSLDDDSPTKTYKRRRRRRRANNFDLTVLQSFAEKSRSNYEDEDFFLGIPDHQEGEENASIVETRSPEILEIPNEIKKRQKIEKTVDIFTKFKRKTSSSSDESTSAASTLVVDHTDHSIWQSFERIPETMSERSNRIARRRKKIRKLSSSSDISNATNPSSVKPVIRSIINLPKWSVKRCGVGCWKIHNLGNFNDGQKNIEPHQPVAHN